MNENQNPKKFTFRDYYEAGRKYKESHPEVYGPDGYLRPPYAPEDYEHTIATPQSQTANSKRERIATFITCTIALAVIAVAVIFLSIHP